MTQSQRALLVMLLTIGALAAIVAAISLLRPYRYHGWLLTTDKPPVDIALTRHTGEPMRLSDYRGKLAVLYFGYTFCPDACPTAMSALARAMKRMGSKANQVQVFMVTVDPERDTADVLGQYVTHFDPRFIGLVGTPEEIAAAAAVFDIFYQKSATTSASGYLVDHTTSIMVVDREGRLRLVLPLDTPAEDIASDLSHLLR